MKRCPNCNKPNPDNSKRCFQCRTDLTQVPVSEPAPETAPQEPAVSRGTEFMGIIRETAGDAVSRFSFMVRHRERVMLVLIIIGLACLLPAVRCSLWLKLAAVIGGLLLWYFLSALERLVKALTDIRSRLLLSVEAKRDESEAEEDK